MALGPMEEGRGAAARVHGGETFKMEYYVSGTVSATRDEATRAELAKVPGCKGATHFVYGFNLGAFALGSTKELKVEANGSAYGFGMGAAGSKSKSAEKRGGDLARCKAESMKEVLETGRYEPKSCGISGLHIAAPPGLLTLAHMKQRTVGDFLPDSMVWSLPSGVSDDSSYASTLARWDSRARARIGRVDLAHDAAGVQHDRRATGRCFAASTSIVWLSPFARRGARAACRLAELHHPRRA